MKEFVEKLIERLEEKNERLETKIKKNCKNCTKKYKCVESDYFKKLSETWKQQTMSRFERVE